MKVRQIEPNKLLNTINLMVLGVKNDKGQTMYVGLIIYKSENIIRC